MSSATPPPAARSAPPATLECELLDRHRFRSHAEARIAIFDLIEAWYNPRRRYWALDHLSLSPSEAIL